MKELDTRINKKIYYSSLPILFLSMVLGLFVGNPRMAEPEIGYLWHAFVVVVFFSLLLLYPKFETSKMRVMIIAGVFIYFYTLFFLYNETFTTFLLICLIPAISIFFFDSKLFYFSLVINAILVSIIFVYLTIVMEQGNYLAYTQFDLVGNFINFIASQVLFFLIYYMTYERMKKIQLYYEQVRQAEQLKVTGQLAAAVAHEIRNPLTVVKGFLQLYEKDSLTDEKMKHHFHLMIEELDAAEEVISQYLTLAKPNDNGTVETVNVKTSLQGVTDLLRSYGIQRNNQISLEIDDDCYIAANKFEMKQLFMNIIKNAIEVSEEGADVLVQALKNGNKIEIYVKDSGIGMSEAEMKTLGKPFYSLKTKGTGLGLMICFNIVEKNSGSIHFSSIKGEGTTVTLIFPAIDEN